MANCPMQTRRQTNPFAVQIATNQPANNGRQSRLTDEEYFRRIPPGYRFKPTDEEIFTRYLMKKINNEQLPRNRIHAVRLYDFSPDYLADNFIGTGENEWYFLTPRDKKYKNGRRPRRGVGEGYWKASGVDRVIFCNGEGIGRRRTLSYRRGKPPGEKTSWIMDEYYIKDLRPPVCTSENDMRLDDWVLCRIHKNKSDNNNNNNNKTDTNKKKSKDTEEEGQNVAERNAIVASEEARVVPGNEASQRQNAAVRNPTVTLEEAVVVPPNVAFQRQNAAVRIPTVALEEAIVVPPNVSFQHQNVDTFALQHYNSFSGGLEGSPSFSSNQQAGMGTYYNYNISTSTNIAPQVYPQSLNAIQGNHFAAVSSPHQYHQYLSSQVSRPIPMSQDQQCAYVWRNQYSTVGLGYPNHHPNEIPTPIPGSQDGNHVASTSDCPQYDSSQIPRPISTSQGDGFPSFVRLDVNERSDLEYVLDEWNQNPFGWPLPSHIHRL